MNALQVAFVVLLGLAGMFISAAIVQRGDETYMEALVSVVQVAIAYALVGALCFGAITVFLWLGRVKP